MVPLRRSIDGGPLDGPWDGRSDRRSTDPLVVPWTLGRSCSCEVAWTGARTTLGRSFGQRTVKSLDSGLSKELSRERSFERALGRSFFRRSLRRPLGRALGRSLGCWPQRLRRTSFGVLDGTGECRREKAQTGQCGKLESARPRRGRNKARQRGQAPNGEAATACSTRSLQTVPQNGLSRGLETASLQSPSRRTLCEVPRDGPSGRWPSRTGRRLRDRGKRQSLLTVPRDGLSKRSLKTALRGGPTARSLLEGPSRMWPTRTSAAAKGSGRRSLEGPS
ncbi:hypothetical protein M885DRAFT_35294 [Pelagophyceae sp. CCMP2097]|nr:hypothetical protein M885DRAFT_35294 [Pelagophyceae sp. CCMP2097]